jgi:biopolymer transport protein ExbD
MIDMTFLLLVFFMVTSKMSNDERRVEVELPLAATAVVPDDLSHRDIVGIDAEGRFRLGEHVAEEDEVGIHLKERFREFPPLRVWIRADRDAPAGQLKRLMRLCGEAGALDIIIGARPDS